MGVKDEDIKLMTHIKELRDSVDKLKQKRTPKFFRGKKKGKDGSKKARN